MLLSLAACGDSSASSSDAGAPDAAPPPVINLAIACEDTPETLYGAVPIDLPAYDSTHRGDVIRCTRDRYVAAAQLDSVARTEGYTGPALASGMTIFRIAFRTERMTPASGPAPEGFSSAFLLVPDRPRAAGALVVYAHPSVGLADSCAPSRIDLTASADGWAPVRVPMLALAGAGWTVVAPDFAGFGYGGAPGFSVAEDEAHSMLDATRAARNTLGETQTPTKVVMVGHSIGGHAALAAHAYARSYGLAGELAGVATFAPFWLTNLAWGAVMHPVGGFTTAAHGYLLEFQLDYFYSHSEMYDGPGHGTDLVQPAKRELVKQLVTTQCLDNVAQSITELGATPQDYYETDAITDLGICGISGDCGGALSQVWEPRWLADRPPLDPVGAPIAIWYGAKDALINPGFARCEIERISGDMGITGSTTAVTYCSDATSIHTGMPINNVGWVNDWIAARVGGGAEPPCTAPATPDDGGDPCPGAPPNIP